MSYTILAAKYANAQNTAVILQTAEFGDVVVNETDRPELWEQMVQSGVSISAYVPLPPPAPVHPTETILRSADGTAYKITVDNDGTIASEPVS